jgi:hypothetical protein
MTLITDIIKYFAKFPDKAGVLKNFSRSSGTISGYDALMAEINLLPDVSLIPDIKDYIFSTDETVVVERIRNIKSYFMLLEYGNIGTSSPDKAKTRETGINLAITIGYPHNDKNQDIIEESLIMDSCLDMIITVANKMIEGNKELCPNLHYAQATINISPVEPMLLYQNMGWTLSFQKQHNTLI